MKYVFAVLIFLSGLYMIGCGNSQKESLNANESVYPDLNDTLSTELNNTTMPKRSIVPIDIDFKSTTSQNNKAAYVTSQCYTKTVDENGKIHNPCFACHINSKVPNNINDWSLQESNAFGEYTRVNRFTNLFKDRTELVADISDEEILTYVREENYIQDGTLLLAEKLKALPPEWDVNSDGKWNGYMPDCYFSFDDDGFDKTKDGNYTGWRAFGYYPFLGTFWPTNGSTDDVLIRLASEFMKDVNGTFNLEVYKLNLSIVESLIKQKDIPIDEIDERKYGVDLNQDTTLGLAKTIVFKWVKPSYNTQNGKITNFSMSYVGLAKELLEQNSYMIAPGLYPKNTEFLHSVRYIDIDENSDAVMMAQRMKELRYAKKLAWITYAQLSNAISTDIKEKDNFPNRLRTIRGNSENGALNNIGWIYQGFIEDAKGELRPQNYEETQYCIGCHSGIGAITDSTFVFARKFDNSHFQKGWYHWTQDSNGLKNIKEPKTADGRDEYSLYIELNNAGDEFRANNEVQNKFFDESGMLIDSEVKKINSDISYLLLPSVERAKDLNKAYKIIVEEQSYIYGRDAHIKPVKNVHKEVSIDESTMIEAIKY